MELDTLYDININQAETDVKAFSNQLVFFIIENDHDRQFPPWSSKSSIEEENRFSNIA